eukprot:13148466-Ditylum_brightwellii.AAC.1
MNSNSPPSEISDIRPPMAKRRRRSMNRNSICSFASSVTSMNFDDVDIGRNHSINLINGRESHTADLAEFDRYVSRLRMIERGGEFLGDNNGLLMRRSSLPTLCGDDDDDASD